MIFDSKTGDVKQVEPMNTPRVGHGQLKIGDYVYAIGGRPINYIMAELNTCERLNISLENQPWQLDLPDMLFGSSCMTTLKVKNTCIYAFCYMNTLNM